MDTVKGLRLKSTSVINGASGSSSHHCAGCGKIIKDRYLLQALDSYWHEDCLKCGCCDCRLGEVGSTLYTRANLILCKRDYLRLFGTTGNCAACCKVIPAFEMVMRAKSNVYHLECFACHQCHQRFCVGDRFYLCENKILCEYDYEERLIFANMAPNPVHLAHMQTQVTETQSLDTTVGSNPLNRGGNVTSSRLWNVPFYPANGMSSLVNRPPVENITSDPCYPSVHSLEASTSHRLNVGPLHLPNGSSPGPPLHNGKQPGAHSTPTPAAAAAAAPLNKQDSPAGEDASSSGYGSPDSGLMDEG